MIEIDGAIGEGGGQILRTSIALSITTGTPVRIFNIRKNRPKGGGLRPQHITAINALKIISDSKVQNIFEGSKEIIFIPGTPKPGKYKLNIGTAGSISLVLQAVLPAIASIDGTFEFHITGGTDVSWSPPIDYLRNVLFPVLKEMGINTEINVLKRGYYPKGGGEVLIRINGQDNLKPIIAIERNENVRIKGISHVTNLPKHIAERQANSAIKLIKNAGFTEISIDIEHNYSREYIGKGSGICIWAEGENIGIGGDALGEKGKRAEVVGQEAAKKLISALETKMSFDLHMGDMLIPFLAIAKGISKIGVSHITKHLITNIEIVKQILKTTIKIQEKDSGAIIIVEP